MRGALLGGDPALVVNLSSGHVLVPEEMLHLADVLTSIEQQRCGGGPERVWSVDPSVAKNLCSGSQTMEDMQHAFLQVFAGTESQHELTFGAS